MKAAAKLYSVSKELEVPQDRLACSIVDSRDVIYPASRRSHGFVYMESIFSLDMAENVQTTRTAASNPHTGHGSFGPLPNKYVRKTSANPWGEEEW
jgi:hypothetical protein